MTTTTMSKAERLYKACRALVKYTHHAIMAEERRDPRVHAKIRELNRRINELTPCSCALCVIREGD